MKAIPVITVLLTCLTALLQYALDLLGDWHWYLHRIPGIDPELIAVHHHYLQLAGMSRLGLVLLCLILIIVIWQNRLCHRWLTAGILLLWILMLCYQLLRPIV